MTLLDGPRMHPLSRMTITTGSRRADACPHCAAGLSRFVETGWDEVLDMAATRYTHNVPGRGIIACEADKGVYT